MALDRQKILNELGSVVNQLQSADCGCMGKIFSNCRHPNNSGNPQPCGYSGHCCHGHGNNSSSNGYNAPCAGEPYSGSPNWMGSCNPKRLYADTYNYMNTNLMQPTVKEVYEDLKSISPANTMMNNPMASQMGLPAASNAQSPNMGSNMGQNQPGFSTQGYDQSQEMSGNMSQNQMSRGNVQQPNMSNMMAQKIMGQMGFSESGKTQSQNIGSMIAQNVMGQMGMSASGSTPSSNMSGETGNMGQGQIVTPGQMGNGNTYSGNAQGNLMARNVTQNVQPGQQMDNMGQNINPNQQMDNMGQNMSPVPQMGNVGQNMSPNYQMGNIASNPTHQQMANPQTPGKHGAHSAGVGVFNSIFPGVMQGFGGELGFDPMAIAIQMNPSNQQQAAMDSMNKMMMNNREGINKVLDVTSHAMQPAMKGAHAATASLGQNAGQPTSQPASRLQQPYQHGLVPQNTVPAYQSGQQQPGIPTNGVPPEANQGKQQINAGMVSQPYQTSQPVYATVTGVPKMNQAPHQFQQQQYQGQQLQYQQQIDSNAGAVPVYEGSVDPRAQAPQPSASYHQYKEPIFPADRSRPAYYARPREITDAKHQNQPSLQMPRVRSDPMRYSNVKGTISKTSLMGNKPFGAVPSRSQLQHIYNQYKGSQSFTQQNVKPSDRLTHSAGDLQVVNSTRPVLVEKVGGDTVYNNQANNKIAEKVEHVFGRMGDIPAGKPLEQEALPTKQSRCRNGLQDMVFTTYPSTPAWSFHANAQPSYPGYRLRRF